MRPTRSPRATPRPRRNPTAGEIVQAKPLPPTGPLTAGERAQLAEAYRGGARGELLIGLRQRVRLLTLHLPPVASAEAATRRMERTAEQLRALGADGYILARRVRLRGAGALPTPALVVEEEVAGALAQTILLLGTPPLEWRLRHRGLEDPVSRALRAGLRGDRA